MKKYLFLLTLVSYLSISNQCNGVTFRFINKSDAPVKIQLRFQLKIQLPNSGGVLDLGKKTFDLGTVPAKTLVAKQMSAPDSMVEDTTLIIFRFFSKEGSELGNYGPNDIPLVWLATTKKTPRDLIKKGLSSQYIITSINARTFTLDYVKDSLFTIESNDGTHATCTYG